MAKIIWEIPVIAFDEIEYKWYKIVLLYEANTMRFFSIMVDWESMDDIKKEILDKYCPDEVELYKKSFSNNWRDDLSEELNVILLDLIYKHI